MKQVSFLVCILVMVIVIVPTAAQENECSPDVSVAAGLIEEAQNSITSNEIGTAMQHIVEAKAALEMVMAQCTDYAAATSGDTRTNPVPFGQRQHVEMRRWIGSIQLVEYINDAGDYIEAANDRNDPAPPGTRYIAFRLNYACEKPASESCEFTMFDFSAVGDKGIAYTWDSGDAYDIRIRDINLEQEIFGGSEIEIVLAFLVNDDDGNFILFTENGDPRVFFSST